MMTIYKEVPARNSFKKAIREARRAAHLDQESLALLVGVSVSTIKKWEAGSCRPTPTNIAKVAAVLAPNVPEEYINALTEEYAK